MPGPLYLMRSWHSGREGLPPLPRSIIWRPGRTHVLVPGSKSMYRSEEHTSELQSRLHLVCRLLLEKKKRGPEYAAHQLLFAHTAHAAVCQHGWPYCVDALIDVEAHDKQPQRDAARALRPHVSPQPA